MGSRCTALLNSYIENFLYPDAEVAENVGEPKDAAQVMDAGVAAPQDAGAVGAPQHESAMPDSAYDHFEDWQLEEVEWAAIASACP